MAQQRTGASDSDSDSSNDSSSKGLWEKCDKELVEKFKRCFYKLIGLWK